MNGLGGRPRVAIAGLLLLFAVPAALLSVGAVSEEHIAWMGADLKHENIQDVVIGLLAAQAALIALVFPLIIALVGVLFELRTTSGGRLDIFLKETESVVVGSSALALCAVLAIQLLLLPYVVPAASVMMTIVDVLWFILNVAFLAFFLLNTLNFVRPERRAELNRRYVVNIAWRGELRDLITSNRLSHAVEYGYLPSTPGDLESGPKVLVSSMSLDSIPSAVSVALRQSSSLEDVRLPVLRVVAEAWLQRARGRTAEGELSWLVFQPAPLVPYSGEVVLARAPADLPLTATERMLIRLAYRFRKSSGPGTTPDTASLLKEHVGDLVPLIDAGRLQEFETGIEQLIDLHIFFYRIAQAQDEPFSYAQMGAFEWHAAGEIWASQYRDILKRAVARLDAEPKFFSACAYLASRLYGEATVAAPPAALASVVTIAMTLFHRLIEWAENARQADTGRAGDPGVALRLPAARSSTYGEAWREFVAGWERLGAEIASVSPQKRDTWSALSEAFTPIFNHLRNTATMVAGGAKGGDVLAVGWATDMLVKWEEHMQRGWGGQDTDMLSDGFLITSDVFAEAWERVTENTQSLLSDTLQPRSVFGAAVRHAYADVQLVSICVLIRWALRTNATGAAAVAAGNLIRGRSHDHDSESGHRQPTLKSAADVLEAVIRIAYSERRIDDGYSAALDGLAERLDGLTTEPLVSGRIYSIDSVHGLQELRTELALVLAVLARRSPPSGGRLPSDIESVLQRLLVEDDALARRLLARLENMRDALRALDPATYGPLFSALAG